MAPPTSGTNQPPAFARGFPSNDQRSRRASPPAIEPWMPAVREYRDEAASRAGPRSHNAFRIYRESVEARWETLGMVGELAQREKKLGEYSGRVGNCAVQSGVDGTD